MALLTGGEKQHVERKGSSTKRLLSDMSTICVNPVYVMVTGKDEVKSMQDEGLLENSNLRTNQACSTL